MRPTCKLALVLLLGLAAFPARAGLDSGTVARGLVQALEVGIDRAVQRTGVRDGFFKNEAIKILLPDELKPLAQVLERVGASGLVDGLVEKMNRAAEAAAPAAKDIFLSAIRRLTFHDAAAILRGKEDEATLFLQRTAGPELHAALLPIVTDTIESVGALKAFNDLVGKARGLPLLGAAGMDLGEFDLNLYVTDRAVAGLFHVLGEEERKIRKDPAARVTDLLGTVFGSL